MKPTKLILPAALLLALTQTACLTTSIFPVFKSVKVKSTPPGATVTLYDESQVIAQETTPARIYLFRNRNLTMHISKPGYKTKRVEIRYGVSAARVAISSGFGLLCGLFPLGIDYLTGTWEVPNQQNYDIELEPGEGMEENIIVTLRIENDILIVE